MAMIIDLLQDSRFEFGDERVCGFVNIESGSVEISTRPFYNCPECSVERTEAFQVNCKHCGRSSENSMTLLAGDGDWNYPVLDYWPEDSFPFSIFLCDPKLNRRFSDIQNQAMNGTDVHVSAATDLRNAVVNIFENTSSGDIVHAGSLILGIQNSVQFSRGGIFMTQFVFADSHRKLELIDGASVSVPKDAIKYDVFLIAKDLKASLEEGKRPEILAVILCPSGKGSELFGTSTPTVVSQDTFFEKNDLWIEASRAGRDDIRALMTNWNLSMWWGDKSSQADNQLCSRTAAEAYLHQLKFWHRSGDSLKAVQFEMADYSEGLSMAEDPIELLSEAKLSWLGVGPPTHLDGQNNLLSSPDLGTEANVRTSELAAVCTLCGSKFASSDVKFCAFCGSSRA
jgi:hypothetical protein